MDQLRRVLATIAKHLGQMGATQKLLVGSLAVIVFMALFVVNVVVTAIGIRMTTH